MTGREWDALRIVRWMHRQEETDLAAWLAEDFVYDDGISVEGREAYLMAHRISGATVDLALIELLCDREVTAIMFGGTDTVTLLRRRYCEIITWRGRQVVRVTQCSQIVPPRRP